MPCRAVRRYGSLLYSLLNGLFIFVLYYSLFLFKEVLAKRVHLGPSAILEYPEFFCFIKISEELAGQYRYYLHEHVEVRPYL